MEFRKRSIETNSSPIISNENKVAKLPPNIQNLNRRLIVSIKSELFEISKLNELDILCPYPSMDKSYNQNSRFRNFEYALPSNGSMVLKEIVNYWNYNAKENNINTPRFSVRNTPSEEKQEAS